jgi:hypothetical protein
VFKLLIDDASNERYNQYLIRNEKVEKWELRMMEL